MKDSQEWHNVYNSAMADPTSSVTVSCPVEVNSDKQFCDTFEVGIIGNLEYEMYDIVIMITNTPQDLLVHNLGRLNFRLSHINDSMLSWLATVRLICLLVTGWRILMYFVTNCSREGCNAMAFLTFNLDQWWVISLLICCAFYDEPLFELRRNTPSIALAVISEIPVSLFFTGLLTYWLMGVTMVRV